MSAARPVGGQSGDEHRPHGGVGRERQLLDARTVRLERRHQRDHVQLQPLVGYVGLTLVGNIGLSAVPGWLCRFNPGWSCRFKCSPWLVM